MGETSYEDIQSIRLAIENTQRELQTLEGELPKKIAEYKYYYKFQEAKLATIEAFIQNESRDSLSAVDRRTRALATTEYKNFLLDYKRVCMEKEEMEFRAKRLFGKLESLRSLLSVEKSFIPRL